MTTAAEVFALLILIFLAGFALGLIAGNGRYVLLRRRLWILTHKLESSFKRLEPES